MGAQRFQMAFLIYFTKLNIYSTKYSMKNNNLKFCAFAAVLIIAVAGITFTSCNKDEKESRMEDISKAVGTWSCIRSTETYQGVNQEDLVVDGKVVSIWMVLIHLRLKQSDIKEPIPMTENVLRLQKAPESPL